MRRFLFGAVIASFTTFMPAWALGGDTEIAKAVMAELQQQKAAGNLKGFDIDLKVKDGVVYLDGNVSSTQQLAMVARAATREVGKNNLVNHLTVTGRSDSTAKRLPTREQRPKQPTSSRKQPTSSRKNSSVQPAAVREQSNRPAATDVAVTDRVIAQLQKHKAAGRLRGFELDVSTVNGDVWLRGKVGARQHKALILDTARRVPGVLRVIDDITVTSANGIQPASTGRGSVAQTSSPRMPASQPRPIPATPVSRPVPVQDPVVGQTMAPANTIPQGSSMPMAGQIVGQPVAAGPQAFAPSSLTNVQGVPVGQPVPMQGAGVQYGAGAPRYDQPNMPSYAWPSYAAYPNYGAVTYPQQYSPSAWPYIGPFYPYPQVPLGWRKVTLEWDDGLWYLDFTSK